MCWKLRISWIHRTARRGSQGAGALDVLEAMDPLEA